MAVNVPNPGLYIADLAQRITALRNAYQGDHGIVNANAYLQAMGGATFLTAAPPDGLGLALNDANAVVAALGNLATQPALVTALANSETLWGGA